MNLKEKIYDLLRWSEKYTKTDMVYLVKGGFWLNLAKVISSVSAFLLAIAFANLLSQETFGMYKYILSIASILAIPTLSGINTAILKAVAQGKESSFTHGLKTRLHWGALSSLASLGLAGYYFFNDNLSLTFCFLIVAVFLPLMESFSIYDSFWGGKKLFKTQSKYTIITQILAVSILIITLFLTKNLFIILLAYFISYTFLHFIFLQITLKKLHSQKTDPKTISYGKHLSFIQIIGAVAKHFDKILIWHFLGAIPVAIYSFAITPPEKIKELFYTLGPLALPKFSQQSLKNLKSTLLKKVLKLFLILIPIAGLYVIFAPIIYKILFPPYLNSVPYSQIFVLTLLLTPQTLFSTLLTAQERKKELYIFQLTSPILRILLLLILLPLYGIWGAIFAIIISDFSSLGLLLFLFKRM